MHMHVSGRRNARCQQSAPWTTGRSDPSQSSIWARSFSTVENNCAQKPVPAGPARAGTLAGMTTTVMVRRVRGATNVGAGAMGLAPA